MPTVIQTIDESKIDTKFKELFASQSLNRRFRALARGIVRGFVPVQGSSNGFLDLVPDVVTGDSVANSGGSGVYSREVVTVREANTVTLDLSGLDPDRYYLAIRPNYTPGLPTNSEYVVYDAADIAADAHINQGATILTAVDTDGTSSPVQIVLFESSDITPSGSREDAALEKSGTYKGYVREVKTIDFGSPLDNIDIQISGGTLTQDPAEGTGLGVTRWQANDVGDTLSLSFNLRVGGAPGSQGAFTLLGNSPDPLTGSSVVVSVYNSVGNRTSDITTGISLPFRRPFGILLDGTSVGLTITMVASVAGQIVDLDRFTVYATTPNLEGLGDTSSTEGLFHALKVGSGKGEGARIYPPLPTPTAEPTLIVDFPAPNGLLDVRGSLSVEGDSTTEGNSVVEGDSTTEGNSTTEGDSLVEGSLTTTGVEVVDDTDSPTSYNPVTASNAPIAIGRLEFDGTSWGLVSGSVFGITAIDTSGGQPTLTIPDIGAQPNRVVCSLTYQPGLAVTQTQKLLVVGSIAANLLAISWVDPDTGVTTLPFENGDRIHVVVYSVGRPL